MKKKPKLQILSAEEVRMQKIMNSVDVDAVSGSTNQMKHFTTTCPCSDTNVWCSGVDYRIRWKTIGGKQYLEGLICIQEDGSEHPSQLCDLSNVPCQSGSGSGSGADSGSSSGFF